MELPADQEAKALKERAASLFKAAVPPKPALVYAAPDKRGIELKKLAWSRSLRRAIVAGTTTVTATLATDRMGNVKATLYLNGYQANQTKPLHYGEVEAGYRIGEMVGEKKVAKVTFERLTDCNNELGKSGVVFGFFYTFEDLTAFANEAASRSI